MRIRIDKPSALFLFLSTVSGLVELGLVFIALAHDLPLDQVAALGLSYQLGNLVPNPLVLGTRARLVVAFTAVAASAAALDSLGIVPLFATGATLGAVIQSLRRLSKDSVSTTMKRAFRILGFVLAPAMTVAALLAVSVALLLASLASRETAQPTRLRRPRLGFLTLVMVVHQVHYFSYVYFIVPVVLIAARGQPLAAGVYFAMGWITYTSTAHLLRGTRYVRYFIAGHLGLTCVLLAIACSHSPAVITVLWVITGFGGGTVFCLERIAEQSHELSKPDLGFAENLGHIVGVVAGLAVYLSSAAPHAPVVLAAGSALTACVLLLVHGARRPACEAVSRC
jgi:hypothetical protein